jgi:3alpha(or 20beta)-hydroxysteroid dehydrogenase
VPALEARGGGAIVNISSVEGLGGGAALTAYTASKFAVRGMTKAAAIELGPKGIRVNSVHPGAIRTDMVLAQTGGSEDAERWMARKVALKRMGQPHEVASLIAFLASDDSSYCTGAEFVVDGGATASSGFS